MADCAHRHVERHLDRSRIDRVAAWLERNEVDAIAFQETKAREDQFPFDRFEALGYEVAHHGLSPVERRGHRLTGRARRRAESASDDDARLG